MRLNFSNADVEMINKGIYRLGVTMKHEMVRNQVVLEDYLWGSSRQSV
jgi:hypothetical protein